MTERRHRLLWGNRAGLPMDFCFVPTATAWKRLMAEIDHSDSDYPHNKGESPSVGARTTKFFDAKNNRPLVVVTVNHDLDKASEADNVMAILVHEAVHVWQYTMEVIGEEKPSPEFEAYGIQRIFNDLLHGYNVTRWHYVKETKK